MILYKTLFLALLLGGAAATPTDRNKCVDGVCGGVCGDGSVSSHLVWPEASH